MAPTDEVMPKLPEPLESLVRDALYTRGQSDRAAQIAHVALGHWGEQEAATAANHAAYEAERALRLAILAYPHDAAFGAIARLTDEGTTSKE